MRKGRRPAPSSFSTMGSSRSWRVIGRVSKIMTLPPLIRRKREAGANFRKVLQYPRRQVFEDKRAANGGFSAVAAWESAESGFAGMMSHLFGNAGIFLMMFLLQLIFAAAAMTDTPLR